MNPLITLTQVVSGLVMAAMLIAAFVVLVLEIITRL